MIATSMRLHTINRKNKIKDWAVTTVKNGYNLCNPVRGGFYQYSTHYDWDYLHFEKLLTRQVRYIKIFINDYWSNDRPQSLTKAKEIIGYCDRFLKQDISYGNVQDTDLIPGEHSEKYYNLNGKDRLAQGIPRIDTNTNSNADMVSVLMQLKIFYLSTGTPFYSLIYKYAPDDVPKDKAYLSGDFDKDVLFYMYF